MKLRIKHLIYLILASMLVYLIYGKFLRNIPLGRNNTMNQEYFINFFITSIPSWKTIYQNIAFYALFSLLSYSASPSRIGLGAVIAALLVIPLQYLTGYGFPSLVTLLVSVASALLGIFLAKKIAPYQLADRTLRMTLPLES